MQSMPAPGERESAYDLFQRGSRMLADRHPGAAAVLLERALALEPGKASILEALGQAYFNVGSHELAAERFAAIVEADPVAHYAHFGRVCHALGWETWSLRAATSTWRCCSSPTARPISAPSNASGTRRSARPHSGSPLSGAIDEGRPAFLAN
jgi:hypothetical protein